MRADLNKEVLRSNTAYRVGRSIMDGFLIAQLALTVAGFIAFCIYQSRLESVNFYTTAGVVCGAVIMVAVTVLQRELVQAVFDIADRALAGAAKSALDENPFKQAG
jgi:hypothetical protein